ncbi:hypothetical protein Pla123a_21310 [Posidoniimonas polymericola]|uniref:HNH endonuclease n=1 Tax=Posidoniimonas polymericola TaxID=2528002 RepID=A0A5C5YRW3_9BACT|nr:hypothetical protein [Posidoniimonas polymericola]TWT77470.1 hypothetical protein Pla123a_21310 [Posidoniimonas polymericola]
MPRPTCYMCDEPATSREHVPPKCLFPEVKDVGADYRQNLLTVPSCDEHNSGKSSDDEFLMVSLAGIIGNNSIGYSHKFSKVNRAIHRSSFSLLDRAMKNQRWSVVEFGPNKFIDVVWGTPDYDRFLRCFDRIARGVHFAQFGRKFSGESRTILGYIPSCLPNPAEFQRLIRDKVAIELEGKPRVGGNPDVFNFRLTDPDPLGLYLAHLQFYGGLDVYVALTPDGCQIPDDLTMMLIEGGIETTIKLGAEEYRFNVDEPVTRRPG